MIKGIKNRYQSKKDFEPFPLGTIFNPLKINRKSIKKPKKLVIIDYPNRLEAMAIDPSKIVKNKNLKYTPGQIDFTVQLFKRVKIIRSKNKNEIIISKRTKRKTLVKHAVYLIRDAIGTTDGLYIDVQDMINLRHCGLGSSSSLIAGVACALNEMYGKPITDRQMVKYLAQNHGEEIDGDDKMINPVQCIGGSAACGIYDGGIIIIAGESVVIKNIILDERYEVIIGIPKNFKHPDSKYLMEKEIKNLPKFLKCGEKYGLKIAYKLFHECLPALEEGNLKTIGNLIYEYRWNMGSIKNCSFVYPPIIGISKRLSYLKKDDIADVLSLSSVGPGMFAITKHANICESAFKKEKMNIIRTKIYNGRYKLISAK